MKLLTFLILACSFSATAAQFDFDNLDLKNHMNLENYIKFMDKDECIVGIHKTSGFSTELAINATCLAKERPRVLVIRERDDLDMFMQLQLFIYKRMKALGYRPVITQGNGFYLSNIVFERSK